MLANIWCDRAGRWAEIAYRIWRIGGRQDADALDERDAVGRNAVGVALGGRGGGARGRYQGKASRLSALDEAYAAAEAVMSDSKRAI